MSNSSKSSSKSRTLRVGLVSPIDFQHPWKQIDFVNLMVYLQVFETAFASHRRSGKMDPMLLAEPLKQEESRSDKNIYSSEIRLDIRFSNGMPMTVEHVVNSISQNHYFSTIAEIEARGNRIYFETDLRASTLALRLSNLELSVALNNGDAFLGTGAYFRAEESTPELTRLVRNPHYRRPVAIDEIELHAYPRDQDGTATALIEAVNRGEVDFTHCLAREEAKNVHTARKIFEQGLATCLFYFNTKRKPFDNPLVRRAAAYALDRSAVARSFYANHLAYTASGILPPSMEIVPDRFYNDLDRARELIAESGVDPGARELTLSTICGQRPYLPDPSKAAELIASQLAPLGFRIKVDPTKDLDDYFSRTSAGDYDLMLSGWIPDTPSAADFLDVVLSSKNIPGKELTVMTSINLARWKNEDMDNALAAYRIDADDLRARQVIADLIHTDVPVIALMYGPDITVHSWDIEDVPRGFGDLPLFADIKFVDK